MRKYLCQCGSSLFTDNVSCIDCGSLVGTCPVCNLFVSTSVVDGHLTCGNSTCQQPLVACINHSPDGVCNRFISVNRTTCGLCDYCQLTAVIPDLAPDGNLQNWRKLERAKQRVLFMLDILGLEFRSLADSDSITCPPLRFEFKADGEELVKTGHREGCITVNIREADSVARESNRVAFGEPQRTLVGHFRHELGHYFWDRLIKEQQEDCFRQVFDDERSPDYQEALDTYYEHGPIADWSERHVSAYASMHPWEDFAETFATWLDMCSIVHTAVGFGISQCELNNFEDTLAAYNEVGIVANEFNRDIGLLDLVPEVFNQTIVNKLRFVHNICYGSVNRNVADLA